MNAESFLHTVYQPKSEQQIQDLYSRWALTYDKELAENGYASPRRAAQALAKVCEDRETTVLDIGCGTGVSGEYLKAVGFNILHGSDFSSEMLFEADKKGIYQELFHTRAGRPFDFIDTPYTIMAAIGVFEPGQATPDTLAKLVNLMPKSGKLVFSLNDHAIGDPDYLRTIHLGVKNRLIRIRWQEYGDHIPGIDINSLIFVLERI